MRLMLQLIDISLRRGERPLFERLSCTVHPGQKASLTGRNGSGKSTIFQLILGQLHPEEGDLLKPAGWRLAHMAQQVALTDRGALDYVLDGHKPLRKVQRKLAQAERNGEDLELAHLHTEYADVGGYEAEAQAGEILHGLGFRGENFQQPFRDFSGGWRIRLNLAQALMSPCDLLLLDEPTNHLDLDTTLWLESWLQRFAGTLLIIAHDRTFLDAVTDHTLHLEHGHIDSYRGNYSSFERQRAEALAHRQTAFAKQQVQIKHMEQFVTRFRAKASKAKQAQSRLRALERMTVVAPVYAESPYRFSFTNPEKMSHPLISLNDVAIGYKQQPVLSGIRQSILPGARIGVLGTNGAGKSTLLKCLVGALQPIEGEVIFGQHAKVGYFAQHQLETLDSQSSPLQLLSGAKPDAREQWCRNYLGSWGFGADITERQVDTLSGGEKARLVLALIALTQPALLILDEPTNHLDLEMREALVLALQDYTGALILVSHDRSLLQRTVDDLWLVDSGKLQKFAGGLDDYTALRQPTAAKSVAHLKRAQRQAAAEKRQLGLPLRKAIRKLEAKLEGLGNELQSVEKRLADPEIYTTLPADELAELLAKAGKLRQKKDKAEQAWLMTSEELEQLNQT